MRRQGNGGQGNAACGRRSAEGGVRKAERPTRPRSSRCGFEIRVQVLPCQLSGFGHVVMPVPVLGNEPGSARCIRPCGWEATPGQDSQRAKQVWEPEH